MCSFKITIILTLLCFNTVYGVNIQQFTRSNSLTFEKLEDTRLKYSHVYSDYDLIFTAGLSLVNDPLVIKTLSNSSQVKRVISQMYGLHLGVGLYLTDSLMIGATTTYSEFDTIYGDNIKDFSDINLTLRWRLLAREKWALSIIPQLGIPLHGGEFQVESRHTGEFLSDTSFGYGAKLAFEYLLNWVQLVANLGYRYSEKAEFLDIDMVNQLYTGLGAYVPITRKLGVSLEWTRLWSFPLNNNDINPNEFYLGLSAAMTKSLHVFAGVGLGNPFQDNDGNDYRLSAGIKYTPRKSKKVIPALVEDICKRKHVLYDSNIFVVRFPNNSESFKETPAHLALADQIRLRINEIKEISISGHTSNSATSTYNKSLSERRAKTVSSFLVRSGIPEHFLKIHVEGEESLLDITDKDDGSNEAAALVNRRAEVIIKLNDKFNNCY